MNICGKRDDKKMDIWHRRFPRLMRGDRERPADIICWKNAGKALENNAKMKNARLDVEGARGRKKGGLYEILPECQRRGNGIQGEPRDDGYERDTGPSRVVDDG